MKLHLLLLSALLVCLLASALCEVNQANRQLLRSLLQELIEINTTDPV